MRVQVRVRVRPFPYKACHKCQSLMAPESRFAEYPYMHTAYQSDDMAFSGKKGPRKVVSMHVRSTNLLPGQTQFTVVRRTRRLIE